MQVALVSSFNWTGLFSQSRCTLLDGFKNGEAARASHENQESHRVTIIVIPCPRSLAPPLSPHDACRNHFYIPRTLRAPRSPPQEVSVSPIRMNLTDSRADIPLFRCTIQDPLCKHTQQPQRLFDLHCYRSRGVRWANFRRIPQPTDTVHDEN